MNYKSFNLGDWIGHISGVIEDESELDGNEMRDLVEFLSILKQKSCTDAISRQAVIKLLSYDWANRPAHKAVESVKNLPSVTPKEKIGYCKDCKWWKDNDGVYRRGVGAESKCPINCKKVYEGDGYCFMFEPQESEVDG